MTRSWKAKKLFGSRFLLWPLFVILRRFIYDSWRRRAREPAYSYPPLRFGHGQRYVGTYGTVRFLEQLQVQDNKAEYVLYVPCKSSERVRKKKRLFDLSRNLLTSIVGIHEQTTTSDSREANDITPDSGKWKQLLRNLSQARRGYSCLALRVVRALFHSKELRHRRTIENVYLPILCVPFRRECTAGYVSTHPATDTSLPPNLEEIFFLESKVKTGNLLHHLHFRRRSWVSFVHSLLTRRLVQTRNKRKRRQVLGRLSRSKAKRTQRKVNSK